MGGMRRGRPQAGRLFFRDSSMGASRSLGHVKCRQRVSLDGVSSPHLTHARKNSLPAWGLYTASERQGLERTVSGSIWW